MATRMGSPRTVTWSCPQLHAASRSGMWNTFRPRPTIGVRARAQFFVPQDARRELPSNRCRNQAERAKTGNPLRGVQISRPIAAQSRQNRGVQGGSLGCKLNVDFGRQSVSTEPGKPMGFDPRLRRIDRLLGRPHSPGFNHTILEAYSHFLQRKKRYGPRVRRPGSRRRLHDAMDEHQGCRFRPRTGSGKPPGWQPVIYVELSFRFSKLMVPCSQSTLLRSA
jgi:hypothetical protein